MREKGITEVAALVGGLDAWRNEGHEVATGASGKQL
jgi:rhodanese-related sulfurtransferase